jgi:hypothetical protein
LDAKEIQKQKALVSSRCLSRSVRIKRERCAQRQDGRDWTYVYTCTRINLVGKMVRRGGPILDLIYIKVICETHEVYALKISPDYIHIQSSACSCCHSRV